MIAIYISLSYCQVSFNHKATYDQVEPAMYIRFHHFVKIGLEIYNLYKRFFDRNEK